MEKSFKTNNSKHLAPPPEAKISHRHGFCGAAHTDRLPKTCHSEALAEESSLPVRGKLSPWGAAHTDDKSCHCEGECNEPEAISSDKVDKKKRDCHAPLRCACNDMKKAAFTLAETLITLLVIGVVAALTIPSLMQNINEYTLGKQRDVFAKKFQEGLRQMRIDEKLAEKYATTEDFVNEMGKYFKISAVCEKDNLKECFKTESFTYKDDITDVSFNVPSLKTTRNIAAITGHDLGYTSDVVGIVFSDGVQMLIAVNPECEGINGGNTEGNHYLCFSYIADVNGSKSPSSVSKDIITNINMSALSFEIASEGPINTYSPIDGDYWLGGKAYCAAKGAKMPTNAQLNEIVSKIYANGDCRNSATGYLGGNGYYNCDRNKITSSALWNKITSGKTDVVLWVDVEGNGTNVGVWVISPTSGMDTWGYRLSTSSRFHILCVK